MASCVRQGLDLVFGAWRKEETNVKRPYMHRGNVQTCGGTEMLVSEGVDLLLGMNRLWLGGGNCCRSSGL